MCMNTSRPYDCTLNDGTEECTRGEKAKLYSLVTLIAPIVISFLCLFGVLGTFTCHVYNIEKLLVSRQAQASSEQKPLRAKKVNQNQPDTGREMILTKYEQNNKSRILADDCEGKDQKFDFIQNSQFSFAL